MNLDQYLDEALFLMELIGITVFGPERKKPTGRRRKQTITISSTANFPGNEGYRKPALPDESLKVGIYVKTAMQNLQSSGYQFSPEQIERYGSVDGSRQYTTRNLPLFWLLEEGETRNTVKEQTKVKRYWKDEFVFGEYRFLMYSQWYSNGGNGATKKEFIDWYNTL